MVDETFPGILGDIQQEMDKSIELLKKAKTPELRKCHSEVLVNLSQVFKNFTDIISVIDPDFDDECEFDFDDDFDDDDDDDDSILKF
jgi:hypothetical protein